MSLYDLCFGAALLAVLLPLHALGQRLVSGATVRADLAKGNAARALLQVGHLLGIFLIASSVVAGSTEGDVLLADARNVALYGAAALALHTLGSAVGVRLLLRSRLPAEIARGNVAAGLAGAAHSLSTAILISRNVAGTDLSTLGVAAVFFVLAQVTLYALSGLFRMVTSYDDSEEILGENVAAALSYSGAMIAVAMIVGHGLDGEFAGWVPSLLGTAAVAAWCLVLYPVRQLFLQWILLGMGLSLRAGPLDAGIARDRSVALGALEACTYVAVALMITRLT